MCYGITSVPYSIIWKRIFCSSRRNWVRRLLNTNSGNQLEIVIMSTMMSTSMITYLSYPRYWVIFRHIGGKYAYLRSKWGHTCGHIIVRYSCSLTHVVLDSDWEIANNITFPVQISLSTSLKNLDNRWGVRLYRGRKTGFILDAIYRKSISHIGIIVLR